MGEEGVDDEHIIFNLEDHTKIINLDEGEFFNFNDSNVSNPNEINKPLIYYYWLADTATTSHVSNRHDAFCTYHPLKDTIVSGVGNVKAKAEGQGTVELISSYEGHNYVIHLQNVLHIPTNQNNLISLGRWDKVGGHYQGGGGVITLNSRKGIPVLQGNRIENNLYKMNVAIRKPDISSSLITSTSQTFVTNEMAQSWEIWHRRFGHIGYSGLQNMVTKNLVDRFNVDLNSPKPDCITCTKAKQFIEPFGQKSDHKYKPGELTHIDLWGKYDIASINNNYCYIVFVDDSERFVTIEFLKTKDQAAQKVIEYLAYLKAHDKYPKGIRINRGKEFVNETLNNWCRNQGIEIQMTAPYSPSQNGIAERMNQTIVELACAMIQGSPQFLWEYAVKHASYLRNQSYTKSLHNTTPYERRFKKKPNVSHLREFGTPVWVLIQGQNVP